uniref:Uncharacterized protein n=1 Tax=Opuntia streptacantha TaxID=393608 RepID=A0A7C9EEZ1_OPUST
MQPYKILQCAATRAMLFVPTAFVLNLPIYGKQKRTADVSRCIDHQPSQHSTKSFEQQSTQDLPSPFSLFLLLPLHAHLCISDSSTNFLELAYLPILRTAK